MRGAPGPTVAGRLPMPNSIERALEAALSDRCCLGQILIQKTNDGFVLSHRDDEARDDLQTCRNAEEAIEIANMTMPEIIVRSKPRQTCGMAGD